MAWEVVSGTAWILNYYAGLPKKSEVRGYGIHFPASESTVTISQSFISQPQVNSQWSKSKVKISATRQNTPVTCSAEYLRKDFHMQIELWVSAHGYVEVHAQIKDSKGIGWNFLIPQLLQLPPSLMPGSIVVVLITGSRNGEHQWYLICCFSSEYISLCNVLC